MRKKIQVIQLLNHILLFVFFYSFKFHAASFFLLSVPAYFIVSRIGNDIGFHRLFCHQSFKCNKYVENILLFLGTLDLKGSSIGWTALHLEHHKHSDSPKDPHGSTGFKNMLKIWLVFYDLNTTQLARPAQRLIKDPRHRFFHKYYFIIVAIVICSLFLFASFETFAYIYLIPSVWSFHSSAAINVLCHNFGYQNYDTHDSSTNNLFVNFITLGGGLHNNHHYAPSKLYISKHWYEVDLNGLLIKAYTKISKE